MAPQLTSNALQRILSGEHLESPVVQVLGYKKIQGNSERYVLILSDGNNSYKANMLASQLNSYIFNGDLERNAVIKIDRYTLNQVQAGKKVIVIVGVTVVSRAENVQEQIGNPVSLDGKTSSASSDTTGSTQANRQNGYEQKYNPPNNLQRPAGNVAGSNLDGVSQNVHPINSLTPYQNKWTVKARVTNKTPVKTWSNSRGEGKLFSLDLIDESGEIRATAFNDQCDKFFDSIEVNKVYYISKANLKTANKNFTSIKNDYEMSFNSETTVIVCNDNVNSIPMLQFDFTTISDVENIDKDALIDVIGICKSASDVQTFTARSTNKELKKRDLVLLDRSLKEINLTLWGSEAEKFDGSLNPVVAVKGAKVSDFGGRSLSALNSSVIQINPDIGEAHMLRGWYDQEGSTIHTQSITVKGGAGSSTNWKTFAQVKAENLGMGEKPDYFNSKATVIMVKRENCLYQACPEADCNKKVIDMQNGIFKCEKCGRDFEDFKWRLLLSINLADYTDSQWVTCFQESAETILGITAQELGTLKQQNEEKFNEVLNNANFKSFVFRLRTKMDTYNDESRLKTVVFTATPMNSIEYGKKLLTDIKHLETIL